MQQIEQYVEVGHGDDTRWVVRRVDNLHHESTSSDVYLLKGKTRQGNLTWLIGHTTGDIEQARERHNDDIKLRRKTAGGKWVLVCSVRFPNPHAARRFARDWKVEGQRKSPVPALRKVPMKQRSLARCKHALCVVTSLPKWRSGRRGFIPLVQWHSVKRGKKCVMVDLTL